MGRIEARRFRSGAPRSRQIASRRCGIAIISSQAESFMLPDITISAKLQSPDTIDKLQEMTLSELSISS